MPNNCVELHCGRTPDGRSFQFGRDASGKLFYRVGDAEADRWRGGWVRMGRNVKPQGIRVLVGFARVRLPPTGRAL